MAWKMSGRFLDHCSCKMACRCTLGPAEPDQGWCSGAAIFDIQQGNSEDVSLAGRKVAWVIDLPGDFVGGNGTARLFVDSGTSGEQRGELEAIFRGEKGGPLEAIGAMVTKWLPTETASIEIEYGDNPSVRVGDTGQITLQPIMTEAGQPTRLVNAPVMPVFGLESEDLARSDGGRWSDPDMRRWEAGGYGGIASFSMSS